METIQDLGDLERKILTVLKHHNKKGHITTLGELEMRLGHTSDELQETINDLIKRGWIEEKEGEWMVLVKLF